jgi:hypothetical protein
MSHAVGGVSHPHHHHAPAQHPSTQAPKHEPKPPKVEEPKGQHVDTKA